MIIVLNNLTQYAISICSIKKHALAADPKSTAIEHPSAAPQTPPRYDPNQVRPAEKTVWDALRINIFL
jgi:hypothetical protein